MHNLIGGNNNILHSAARTMVVGHGNKVSGTGNVVKGDGHTVKGEGQVIGDFTSRERDTVDKHRRKHGLRDWEWPKRFLAVLGNLFR